jgi:hypothetical protein
MLYNNIQDSILKAKKRLGSKNAVSKRKRRSDCGKSRLPRAVIKKLNQLLSSQNRPDMRELLSEIKIYCLKNKYPIPARGTLYNYIERAPVPLYHPDRLPEQVKGALYNLDLKTPIPGHQLVFYCVNYGDLKAVSYAAGLPWLSLYQASRIRGFRPKSRGLLEAVIRKRGI